MVIKNKDNISKKIKSSFEAQKFHAPKFEDLFDDNQSIDQKIKSSFEKSVFKAPQFDSIFENDKFNHKIKQSLEAERYVLPDSIWNSIEDKLDVVSVWNRISNKITIKRKDYYSVAVSILVLLLFSLVPFKLTDSFLIENKLINNHTKIKNTVIEEVTKTSVLHQSKPLNISYKNNLKIDEHHFENINIPNHTKNKDILNEEQKFIHRINLNTKLSFIGTHKMDKLMNSVDFELHPKTNGRLSAGFYFSLNNTWLFDEETRGGFSKNSMNSNILSFANTRGFQIDYQTTNRSSLSLYYFTQSTVKSKNGEYSNEGIYQIKTKEINYSKFALVFNYYSKDVKLNDLKIRTVYGLGSYFSLNKNSTISKDNIITAYNVNYKKSDFGLKLNIGKEVLINDLIFGAGITNEIGLKNVEINSKASNYNLGIYLNIRYWFNKFE